MKRLQQTIASIAFLLCLAICSHASAQTADTLKQKALDNITRVVVGGASNVLLKSGNSNSLTIAQQDLPFVKTSIDNTTLTINSQPRATTKGSEPSPISIELKKLNYLKVTGASTVNAENLNTNKLRLLTNGQAIVKLKGLLDVDDIISKGQSVVQLIWIKTPQLHCYTFNNSRLKLAGNVDFFDARLTDHSAIDARHLQTNQAKVQTHLNATAMVYPLQWLQAFAYENSNIYYHKRPQHLTEFTQGSADVLQGDWGQ